MTTYVVGDLQGCLDPLKRLLEHIRFDSTKDKLWFAGDLINRGPQSLDTLRFVQQLGDMAITVLGNHDLHLLAVKVGLRKVSPRDTLQEILAAPDAEQLCDWLRRRPLLHHDEVTNCTMVHAGLHPAWDLGTARALALELEKKFAADDYHYFLPEVYGDSPIQWHVELAGSERMRFALNCFTRMRYITQSGKLDFSFNGPPASAPRELVPWFDMPQRQNKNTKILFGHWSSLGDLNRQGIYALDKGCVWGGSLAAISLDSFALHTVACEGI